LLTSNLLQRCWVKCIEIGVAKLNPVVHTNHTACWTLFASTHPTHKGFPTILTSPEGILPFSVEVTRAKALRTAGGALPAAKTTQESKARIDFFGFILCPMGRALCARR
jgi:hypothetical protein